VWTYLGEAQAVERSKTWNAILEALDKAQGPMSPKKIAEYTGIRGDLVRFTLGGMVKTGDIRSPARGYYTLPLTYPTTTHTRERV
jgi:hypothetical protein